MVFIWWNALPCVQCENLPGRPYEPISYIIVAGTISKWIGNGSSFICSPASQISSIAAAMISVSLAMGLARRDSVADREEAPEGRIDVFLIFDRYGNKVIAIDLLRVDRYQ